MSFEELSALLPDTARVGAQGHLELAGCDVVTLADTYKTPLYVYDEATVRGRARAYRDTLASSYAGASAVCYAAKAYCAPWLLRLMAEEGLSLDVVSAGELSVAKFAAFPMERVYFHGSNKSRDELEMAVLLGVGRIVVDNLEEIAVLGELLRSLGTSQKVLLRVTPGVEAHTHEHIKTGVLDTKFGLSLETGAARAGVEAILGVPGLDLVGLHAHIGSQIFELDPYRESIRRVFDFAVEMRRADPRFILRELSPGGGFAMRYTPGDAPESPFAVAERMGEWVGSAAEATGYGGTLPLLSIEPGRSIIGPAGVAVYRVGSVKSIPGIRTYVSVDGGMADNIRPSTYGAAYAALLANRADEPSQDTYAVAGKYCESGDVLIQKAALPHPQIGDLLAIPASGAYHLAMASNYNMALKPAVVVVDEKGARLVTRREEYADLLRTAV